MSSVKSGIDQRGLQFLKDYLRATKIVDYEKSRSMRSYKGVLLEIVLCRGTQTVRICYICTRPSERGTGKGSETLSFLTALVDQHKLDLLLEVCSIEDAKPYGMTDDQLFGWYERHGFEPIGDMKMRRKHARSG